MFIYQLFNCLFIDCLFVHFHVIVRERKESTHKKGTDHTDGAQDIPLRELSPTSPTEENFKEGNLEGRIDYVHGEPLFHFHGANLAPTSLIAIISLFFTLLLSSLSLLGSK